MIVRKSNAIRHLLVAGVAQIALLGSAAYAQGAPGQDQSTTASSESGAADGIKDIIVTANRQAQNIQKVSAAVEVIDGTKLRDQALTTVAQVFSDTPNVQIIAQPQGFSIAIRGESYDGQAAQRQAPVALEFDGIYTISAQATTLGFFDLGRVETLPGPQSTRYGPNALGGVINVISKDPVLGSFAGNASLTVGNYGLVRGEFGQNIPVTDTFALRIAAAAIHRNSYFKPAQANAIAQSLRVKAMFQPNDRLTLKAQYQLDHVGGTGNGDESGSPVFVAKVEPYAGDSINNYSNPWANPTVYYSGGCYPAPAANQPNNNTGICGSADNHTNIYQRTAIGTVSYRFTDWAAADVTQSYIEETGTQLSCYYGGQGGSANGTQQACSVNHPFAPFYQWSTEARLHNVAGNKIIWNAGFYHWNYLLAHYPGYYPGCGANCNASMAGQYGPASIQKSATATNAEFADVTVPILDRFRVLAGVRESHDKLSRLGNQGGQAEISGKFHNFDYRVGEEFDVTPTVMQYFTLSTGYSPGGVYYNTSNNAATYPNERLQSFELGVKSRLFDNMLQINGDVYYYRIRNLPQSGNYYGFTLPNTDQCNQPPQGQAPVPECVVAPFVANAYTKGAEAQIKFSPTKNDLFGATMSYLIAKYNQKQGTCDTIGISQVPGGTGTATDGNCYVLYNNFGAGPQPLQEYKINGVGFPHAPKFSGTFSYSHTFRFNSGATFEVGGQGSHYSTSYVHTSYEHDALDAAYSEQPSYWQENLSATFTPAGGRWSLLGYVRNLSNYAVKESYMPATLIGDPRTFGGTLSVKW